MRLPTSRERVMTKRRWSVAKKQEGFEVEGWQKPAKLRSAHNRELMSCVHFTLIIVLANAYNAFAGRNDS